MSEDYLKTGRHLASEWVKAAAAGDHTRLTFDRPDSWSQKYNLVWDEVLGLRVFPQEIADKEIAFYLTKQNAFGLPLDSRKTYTKSDWIIWSASMGAALEPGLSVRRSARFHPFRQRRPQAACRSAIGMKRPTAKWSVFVPAAWWGATS